MVEFIEVSKNEIREIASIPVDQCRPEDRDEMAIPSYLHSNPLIRWLMWQRYRKIYNLAKLSSDDNVLEFGCGLGLFLPTLASHCHTVKAIDLFPQFAQFLCQRFQLHVQFLSSLSEIQNRSIDLVVAADVLEHIASPDAVIQEFVRILSPDGRIIVSGPTENAFYKVGRLFAGFWGKGDYHETDIVRLIPIIERNGFQRKRLVGLPFPIPPYLFRIIEFGVVDSASLNRQNFK
jgi:SAM-dependent methyltransferase